MNELIGKMKNEPYVKAIKPEIRPLLEEFLMVPEYQDLFKQFARVVGYEGDDVQQIKNVLFIPNKDGEIMFSIEGMYELFMEFQLTKQLMQNEMYAALLSNYPEAIVNIRELVKRILNKEEVSNLDIEAIFNVDEYERRRSEAGPREDKSGE